MPDRDAILAERRDLEADLARASLAAGAVARDLSALDARRPPALEPLRVEVVLEREGAQDALEHAEADWRLWQAERDRLMQTDQATRTARQQATTALHVHMGHNFDLYAVQAMSFTRDAHAAMRCVEEAYAEARAAWTRAQQAWDLPCRGLTAIAADPVGFVPGPPELTSDDLAKFRSGELTARPPKLALETERPAIRLVEEPDTAS